MQQFSDIIKIIGVNPYVFIPEKDLKQIQKAARKNKGPIPVKGRLNARPPSLRSGVSGQGKSFTFKQTLVKYAGEWRLYLNTPMRQATNTKVGDTVIVEMEFDPEPRLVIMPKQLAVALRKNKKAKEAFVKLPLSRQKEINRYVGFLKSDEARKRNIEKIINYLTGKKTEGVLFR